MRAVDLIAKKRDGLALSAAEIDFLVQGFTRGEIPDYQISAWLMAVLLRGMDRQETTDLTLAMARSGEILDLSAIAPVVVDKHSTGGVGDKTTLVVAPLVAAAGLPVGKMSGRGLGFSGGTLDKLESIAGYNANLSKQQFLQQLAEHGIVVAGQSADLAPADGKLYALRDVTATVESLPLIASSVMSKKIAAGANAIVLDVKVGRGAFMKTLDDALALAQTMVDIGRGVGRRVTAVISDMSQPLGNAVGNALEVAEAIATLQGRGPADFMELCLTVGAQMLLLAGKAVRNSKFEIRNSTEGRALLLVKLLSGAALDKFGEWLAVQGGDWEVVEHPELLPRASVVEPLLARRGGYVAGLDAATVGLTVVALGGGRAKKGDPIDHAVGVVLHRKVGDAVQPGEPLLTIHANDPARLAEARERLLAAYAWSDAPVPKPTLIHKIVRESGISDQGIRNSPLA